MEPDLEKIVQLLRSVVDRDLGKSTFEWWATVHRIDQNLKNSFISLSDSSETEENKLSCINSPGFSHKELIEETWYQAAIEKQMALTPCEMINIAFQVLLDQILRFPSST